MRKTMLPRHPAGWSHPYGHGPFTPFLYADGGDGGDSGSGDSGGDGGQGDTEEGGDSASDSGTGPGQGTGTPANKRASGPDSKGDDDPDARIARLEKELKAANSEAAKARTAAKKQAAEDARKDLAQEIGRALGLVKDEATETDPAKLLEQLKAERTATGDAQAEAISARVEAQIIRTAYGMGIDGDKLLDSRRFCEAVDDLDPSDPKAFREALKKLVKDTADKSPALRLQHAGRSGGDLSGSAGEGGAKTRPTSLSAAVRGAFST